MKRVISLLLAFALIIISMPATVTHVSAANVITVDCNIVIRQVTHCASGSLYGITENTPSDLKNLVEPLHPYVFRNPARGTTANQHPFGDAIKVAKRLSSVPGTKVSIDLADMLPSWPYKWPGISGWLSQVKSFITDKKASGCSNWYGYEIWNEPDGTFQNNDVSFEEMWKQTYNLIRANDPNEKIIGPCYSYYNGNTMKSFLTYCKANNCLPDIISWHELSGISYVANNMKAYRSLEKSLGISELPISINEYCDASHPLEGQPASTASFIGKFERYKVDSALISWWYTAVPGRLGSLLATDTQKGAGWYLFKWYGDMTGNMVSVTPPNDSSNLVDGAACVDSSNKYISFIFGGPNDGTINTTFKNIPSFIGSQANVKIEKIDWVSKDTVPYGPSTVSNKTYNVVNGQITVSLSGCNDSSGYRIYITKADSSQVTTSPVPTTITPETGIISGGTYKLINRNSQKALGVNADSTANDANVIQWEDNGKTSQQWKMVDTGSGYKFINVNAGKALDVSNNSTENGGTVILWTDNGQTNQKWILTSTGDGYYTIQNVNSGKLLDVEKESTENGANVIQWVANNGYNQQWELIRTDVTTPSVSPSPSPSASQTPSGEQGKELSLDATGNGWDGAYNMSIALTNNATANITDWKVELTTSQVNITNIWCAAQSTSGTTITITPENYNSSIASKASISFGFGCNGTIPSYLSYKVYYQTNGTWYSYSGTDNAI